MEYPAKSLCVNYKKLARRQVIIQAYNDKYGYEKLDPPTDDANCEHCDSYPSLIGMKVCFRMRLRLRIIRWWWILRNCHRLYRLQSPIIRR